MMKKILALLLILAMAASLGACAGVEELKKIELPSLPEVSSEPEVETVNDAAGQPEEEAEEPVPEPDPEIPVDGRVIVNFKETSLEGFDPAEGEQLILRFSYVTPHVVIRGRDAAAETINEYLAMLDETYYTGNDYGDGPSTGYNGMLELAEDSFTYARESGQELPMELYSMRDAKVLRADDHVLTILMTDDQYTGGVHGIYSDRAYVFDTENGKLVTLDQLSGDYEALSAEILRQMLKQSEEDEDIASAMDSFIPEEERESALSALLREGSWYLDGDGMVLFSDLYELSSYAAGILSFRIPYADLEGLIDVRWIPGEKTAEGEFSFLFMDDVKDGSFEFVDKVTVSENGEELCLRCEGTAFDVSLSRVEYLDYLDAFSARDQIWCCSSMQDAAVQLAAVLPEGVPNLMLSYRSGGEEHRCLLTQSGEDGSLILLSEGIYIIG